MIVGVAVVELRVHASQSLKEKRGVVRRIVGRLQHRFNASVSEVGGQDTWQRAVLGLSLVGHDEAAVRRTLARALAFVEEIGLAEVLGSEIDVTRMPLATTPFEASLAGAGSEDAGDDGSDDGGPDDAEGDAYGDDDLDLPWSGGSGRGPAGGSREG
jgi:uncharacterized protein YlxP (DUF503 family)